MKKKRLFPLYIGAVLAVMYVPIFLVILYSFNQSRLSSVWNGFTFRWYAELFNDRSMFEALRNSVVLALVSSFSAAVTGTLGASGMARLRAEAARRQGVRRVNTAPHRVMEYLSILPVMIPEIIMGMTFLAFFSFLALPPGMLTLAIAHTAFCVPYTYLLVRARLAGMDKSYVEAARILGAGDVRSFRDITLPLLLPAVVSGILISFAMSFDDVIVSVFIAGVQTNTLPIKIYSQIKTGVTPKTNAMCTLIFALTVVLCLVAAALARTGRKNAEHRSGG
ncbi:MAG: ABC transporter permease [Treponema sp.]|jgi:spermidine/putrescine transport system permease protein|nr:ABC transporter permease [Treponema sp.]